MRPEPSPPRRTCIGCRRARPKHELLRLVRGASGEVTVDATGPGRGAYVCPQADCLARATKPGRFAQAFRRPSHAGAALGVAQEAHRTGTPAAAART